MNQSLIFYTHPQSRGRIVRWMLEEVIANYTTIVVPVDGSAKDPKLLRLNPMGKVPVITCGDDVISETAAIITWLAEAYPNKKLWPNDDERGQYYRWLFFMAGPFEHATSARAFNVEAKEEVATSIGYGTYARTMNALIARLDESPYIAGDRFTAADIYVGAQLNFALQFGMVEERMEFIDYTNRVTDRAAFRKANVLDDALM